MDPDNPYRYLEVRGRVAEITEEGADEHIDKMAKKYMGLDKYPASTARRAARVVQDQARAHESDGLRLQFYLKSSSERVMAVRSAA